MKKLVILFFSCTLLLSSVKAGDKDKKYLESSIYSLGGNFYPRFVIEDQSDFTTNSTMGLWALAEYSNLLPCMPNSWKEKGYKPETNYGIDAKIGLTCNFPFKIPFTQFIIGVNYTSNKKSFNSLFGLNFEAGKFYFQALTVESLTSAYDKKEYSEEYVDYYKSKGWGYPSCINGFDPNSWYKIKVMYSVSDDLDLGILSERFYGTCLSSEYKLNKLLKFKFLFGKDFEFSKNVFCFGLLLDMNKTISE